MSLIKLWDLLTKKEPPPCKARRAEFVKEFMLAEIASDSDATIEQILTRAVIDADAFLKWEEEQ